MFTISKRIDSTGQEISSIKMTEAQLAQLSQVKRGKSLFGCTVLHSGYSGSAVQENRPLDDGAAHQLVFSYQDICFGVIIFVGPGEKPWVRPGSEQQIQTIEELAPTYAAVSPDGGSINFYVYPEVYLIRTYP